VLVGVINEPHFGFVLRFGPFAIVWKERAQTASASVLFWWKREVSAVPFESSKES